MPTKAKAKQNLVTPSFTQEEAKAVAHMLSGWRDNLRGVGNVAQAEYCAYLRQKIVDASGKTPDLNPTTEVDLDE